MVIGSLLEVCTSVSFDEMEQASPVATSRGSPVLVVDPASQKRVAEQRESTSDPSGCGAGDGCVSFYPRARASPELTLPQLPASALAFDATKQWPPTAKPSTCPVSVHTVLPSSPKQYPL